MRLTKILHVTGALTLLACAVGAGCSGDDSTAPVGSTAGAVSVSMANSVSQSYKQVNLMVHQVEILHPDTNQWIVVSSPNRTINLLGLNQTATQLLGKPTQLASGHYRKMRMKLGAQGSILLNNGLTKQLYIPDELQDGLLLDCDVGVIDGKVTQVVIDLDLSRAIQIVTTNGIDKYVLHGIGNVFDSDNCGHISGKFRDKLSGDGLPGVDIFAEYLDQDGRPHIQRKVATDQFGKYDLDGLPFGKTYYVVARPNVLGKAFRSIASQGIPLTKDQSSGLFDGDCDLDQDGLSSVKGIITPALTTGGCDEVELVQKLACGTSCNNWFVVGSTLAQIGQDENFFFDQLTKGQYGIQTSRVKYGKGGLANWSPFWVGKDLDVLPNQSFQQAVKLAK